MRKKITLLLISLFFALIICSTASATEIVSKNSAGKIGNGNCGGVSISDDGRYVAFISNATNLVSGDTNNLYDVFVRDRVTNKTTRVSLTKDGKQITTGTGPSFASISGNGRYVTYQSDGNLGWTNSDMTNRGITQIYVYDRITKSTEIMNGNGGNGASYYPSISADGRYVTFASAANDLVAGDTNKQTDLFLWDRRTGTITRVYTETYNNHITNFNPSISADGRYIAFTRANMTSQSCIFVIDTLTNTTKQIMGKSASGTPVAPNGYMYCPKISGNGRYVTFYSDATNLDPKDTNNRDDVYRADMFQPVAYATLVSISKTNTAGNGQSYVPSISYDGRYVAFLSGATDLVSGDTNTEDVFVRDMVLGKTKKLSVSSSGISGNGYSGDISLRSDGKYAVFTSSASNLVSGDTNRQNDVFINSVDFKPPVLSATSPKNGTAGVSRTATISIRLSENIKSSTNWSKVYVKNIKTGSKCHITAWITGNHIYIKTNSKKSASTQYQVYIPISAVKDYAGNNLATEYTFKFKTGKYWKN